MRVTADDNTSNNAPTVSAVGTVGTLLFAVACRCRWCPFQAFPSLPHSPPTLPIHPCSSAATCVPLFPAPLAAPSQRCYRFGCSSHILLNRMHRRMLSMRGGEPGEDI